jgi:hypothetical protein
MLKYDINILFHQKQTLVMLPHPTKENQQTKKTMNETQA